MKIRFIRSLATASGTYRAGREYDLRDEQEAHRHVRDGHAQYITPPVADRSNQPRKR
jgi:hypothetical protein